jgi:hypothetical protein
MTRRRLPPMISGAALLVSGLLTAIALLHFFWALGGSAGTGTAIPEDNGRPVLTPRPLTTAVVGCALLTAAAIVLGRAGYWGAGLPRWIFYAGTWALAGVFLLRGIGEFRYVGLFKRVRQTRFAKWDTRLFTPLCLVLAILLFAVAQS